MSDQTRRSFLKRAVAAVAAGAGLVLGVNAAKGAETPDPEPMHVTFELRQPTDEAFDRLRVTEPYGIEMPPISGWHRFDVTLDPTVPDGYTLHIDGVRWTSRQA